MYGNAAARRTALIDAGKFLLVAGIAVWLLSVGVPGLGYHWQWYRVPRFLFSAQGGVWTAGPLLHGLLVTLEISALSLLCTLALGLTTALCLLSLLLSGIALALFWQRRLPLVVDWTMAQWTFFLALILVFAVPDLDREWRPILEPYTLARSLEAQGASVHEGRLSETQLGYASLAFRRVIPPAGTSAEVRRLMESPRPAVLLAEPKFYWRQELRPGGLGEEWPTGASRSWRLWDRAPALILNPAARALLGPPGPPGSGSLPNPPAAHPAVSGTAAR